MLLIEVIIMCAKVVLMREKTAESVRNQRLLEMLLEQQYLADSVAKTALLTASDSNRIPLTQEERVALEVQFVGDGGHLRKVWEAVVANQIDQLPVSELMYTSIFSYYSV